jgi:nucleoside-diphosphate-sugar epimerase
VKRRTSGDGQLRHDPLCHRCVTGPEGAAGARLIPPRNASCVFVLEHYSGESHLNVGSDEEVTIADAAKLIAEVIDYKDKFTFDMSRPDGTPRKLLDNSKLIEMGWRARTSLREGLKLTYSDFIARRELSS